MPDSGSDTPEAGAKGAPKASRFTTDVNTKWSDLLLLLCFFVAGLVDSAAFNMYGCFVSMQTGQSSLIPSTNSPLTTSSRKHHLCRSRRKPPTREPPQQSLVPLSCRHRLFRRRRPLLLQLPPSLRPSKAMGPHLILPHPGSPHRPRCTTRYSRRSMEPSPR